MQTLLSNGKTLATSGSVTLADGEVANVVATGNGVVKVQLQGVSGWSTSDRLSGGTGTLRPDARISGPVTFRVQRNEQIHNAAAGYEMAE